MSSDQHYLLNDQYKDASNLNARIQLHVRFSTAKYPWYRWLFDHFDMPAQSRVLELGCGPGILWVENGDRLPEGWEITLSDLSPGMLQEARQNLAGTRGRFSFELFDAQSIPFDAGVFDAVIANHMLYHVPDRAKALSEAHRVLRPGGRFYAATNGRAHLRELRELVDRFDPRPEGEDETARLPGFMFEQAYEELGRWFPKVVLHRRDSALVVTEAEPLVAYVMSGSRMAGGQFNADRRAAFTAFVEQELAAHGAIRITQETGVFEAWRDAV
jgi:SAM-dependent methyltransferase